MDLLKQGLDAQNRLVSLGLNSCEDCPEATRPEFEIVIRNLVMGCIYGQTPDRRVGPYKYRKKDFPKQPWLGYLSDLPRQHLKTRCLAFTFRLIGSVTKAW